MNKLTSKSESAKPLTFLPPGMSERTVGTEEKRNEDYSKYGQFGSVLRSIRNMTYGEFFEMLQRIGVIDENGDLTPHYRRGERPRRKRAKRASTNGVAHHS